MSFFDEDDEPLRTTSRTRTQARVRPRSGRPTGGGSPPDAQSLLMRRIVAFVVGVILLFALVFIVRACNTNRHKNALRDYNLQVSGISTASAQTGSEFFKLLAQGESQSPQTLYSQIVAHKVTADEALKQAEKLSPPDDVRPAHEALLLSLLLRRDALTKIAEDIRPALGDEGDAADKAINSMAGQMQAFTASDVLYSVRVQPFIDQALKDAEVGKQDVVPSRFMNEISWQSPQYVASKLGQQLSTSDGDADGAGKGQTTGPGLHGTGLNGTSYGNVTLQAGVSNRLTYVAGQPFTVSFTNQGDNDEFNVKVTLTMTRESGGAPLTLSKTVPRIAKGEKLTVSLPLNREPPTGTVLTIAVTVAAVPGEKKTDNNKSEYPSLFEG